MEDISVVVRGGLALDMCPMITTHVLMLQVLQELQFSIRSLGEDRGAEGLHDLLHGNALSC